MKFPQSFIFLLPLFLLAACGKDDDVVDPGANSDNANANAVLAETLYTESTTSAAVRTHAQYGYEMPRLKQGSGDAFVVHTLPDGRVNYCLEYNTKLRAAYWTAYKWYAGFSSNYGDSKWNRNQWRQGETFNGYSGSSGPFQPDPVLPQGVRTDLSDYSGSGYQRGHMLGSADRLNSKEANGQTFYLSNIHPQMSTFNEQGIWYNLEIFLRDNYDTASFRDTLYVVKGGTISQGSYTLLRGSLVRPNYYYMAILRYKASDRTNGGYAGIAFWMEHRPNTDAVSAKYAISIDELEAKTGIDFFCNLPDDIENNAERTCVPTFWKLK